MVRRYWVWRLRRDAIKKLKAMGIEVRRDSPEYKIIDAMAHISAGLMATLSRHKFERRFGWARYS